MFSLLRQFKGVRLPKSYSPSLAPRDRKSTEFRDELRESVSKNKKKTFASASNDNAAAKVDPCALKPIVERSKSIKIKPRNVH